LSKPHFLDADPFYREQVIGMKPNRELHDISINVEPITGSVFQAFKRLQINIKIQPGLFLERDVEKDLLFPVVWIEETSQISSSLAKEFRDSVYGARDLISITKYAGLISGAVLSLICIVLFIVIYLKTRSDTI